VKALPKEDETMGCLHRTFPQCGLGAALSLLALGITLTTAFGPAWSEEQRTIKLVVPFSAGGGSDILARLLAERIGRTHGQTIVVENRAGAGTVIGTEAVMRAEPDGNTVLMVANSFIINPALRKRNYDPLTSFEALCLLTRSPNVIAVHSTSPYRTLSDLINAARAKPGDLTMAFNGPATSQQLGYEKLKRAASIDMIPVTFAGGAPAVNALLGQHVTSLFVNYPSASELISAGRLRALANASQKRVEWLADVPTVAELGYPEFEEDAWFGVVVPAKTPSQVVAQLAGWFSGAVAAPELKPKLDAQGFSVVGACGKDFASFLQMQHDVYGRIIRAANLKGE
jgi:tripartite-type tricarboxylate transporter receptor subunit TctC